MESGYRLEPSKTVRDSGKPPSVTTGPQIPCRRIIHNHFSAYKDIPIVTPLYFMSNNSTRYGIFASNTDTETH